VHLFPSLGRTLGSFCTGPDCGTKHALFDQKRLVLQKTLGVTEPRKTGSVLSLMRTRSRPSCSDTLLSSKDPFLHVVLAEPGEYIDSWLYRIAARNGMAVFRFFKTHLPGHTKPSTNAFENLKLLYRFGAAREKDEALLIQRHTLLEPLKPFCIARRWNQITSRRAWLPEKKLYHGDRGIRICPCCRKLEAKRGLATWKRNHQIPGIRYCHEHGEALLLTSKIRCRNVAPPSQNESLGATSLKVNDRRRERLHIQISRDVASALEVCFPG
jgi:hypothetical protein